MIKKKLFSVCFFGVNKVIKFVCVLLFIFLFFYIQYLFICIMLINNCL